MTKLDDQNVAQTKENLCKLKTHCEIVIALCDQNLTDAKESILKEEYEHIAVKTDYKCPLQFKQKRTYVLDKMLETTYPNLKVVFKSINLKGCNNLETL